MAAPNDGLWRGLCAACERPDLAAEERNAIWEHATRVAADAAMHIRAMASTDPAAAADAAAQAGEQGAGFGIAPQAQQQQRSEDHQGIELRRDAEAELEAVRLEAPKARVVIASSAEVRTPSGERKSVTSRNR